MEKNERLDRAMAELAKTASGADKHESLAKAAAYACVMENVTTATFLTEKVEERSALIHELMRLNAESGGTLLPGVPLDNELAAFLAIEALVNTNPGLHPILGQIAALEKLKYMVGESLGSPLQ